LYVTYEYYTITYGGSAISSTDFTRYEVKSRAFIDNITFDRLKNNNLLIDDSVKNAMCEMMELNYKLDLKDQETEGKIITSETVDGHSQTYAISDIEKNAVDKSKINDTKYYNIAKRYLSNTGLLYRGV
jgi:hypothetical protein